jgi:hypothetical protein
MMDKVQEAGNFEKKSMFSALDYQFFEHVQLGV